MKNRIVAVLAVFAFVIGGAIVADVSRSPVTSVAQANHIGQNNVCAAAPWQIFVEMRAYHDGSIRQTYLGRNANWCAGEGATILWWTELWRIYVPQGWCISARINGGPETIYDGELGGDAGWWTAHPGLGYHDDWKTYLRMWDCWSPTPI